MTSRPSAEQRAGRPSPVRAVRVALFTDTFYPNIDGVVVSLTSIIDRLSPEGYSFLVICPDYRVRIRREFAPGTRIVRLRSFPLPQYRSFRFVVTSVARCLREAREFGVDLVHIHSYANLGFVGAAVARRLGVPLLGTYHTLAAEFTRYLSPMTIFGIDRILHHVPAVRSTLPRQRWNPLKELIWRETIRLFNRCDAVVAPSRLTADELRARGLHRPLHAISNGIELELFTPKRRSDHGARILHVGRISFEKRVDIVLVAFARIARELPDATLTIAGDGPARDALRLLAARLGVESRVRFAGFVPHARLAEVYRANDLFVTASPMETQGVVLLEAMSCGVPVIGVDRGAIPDLVRDGENGFVARRPHAASIARHALAALRSPELLRRMSDGAIASVVEHDTRATSARLSVLYRQLVDARG